MFDRIVDAASAHPHAAQGVVWIVNGACVLALAAAVARLWSGSHWRALEWPDRGSTIRPTVAAVVCCAAVQAVLSPPHDLPPLHSRWVESIVYAAGLAATTGLLEEIFFRGFLLGLLQRTQLRPGGILLVQAVAFAAGHSVAGPATMTCAAWAAIVFTLLTWWSGSLWPAMLVHGALNAWQAMLVGGRDAPTLFAQPMLSPESALWLTTAALAGTLALEAALRTKALWPLSSATSR